MPNLVSWLELRLEVVTLCRSSRMRPGSDQNHTQQICWMHVCFARGSCFAIVDSEERKLSLFVFNGTNERVAL